MIEIQLTQGQVAIVNEIDKDLDSFNWYATKVTTGKFYAVRHLCRENGKIIKESLHKVIGKRIGIVGIVEHHDRDSLNCQRANLRPATSSQNSINRELDCRNKSGFKGVYFFKRDQRWRANLVVNYKKVFLGTYDSPEEAAQVYDRAALQYFGNFAWLNFPILKLINNIERKVDLKQ